MTRPAPDDTLRPHLAAQAVAIAAVGLGRVFAPEAAGLGADGVVIWATTVLVAGTLAAGLGTLGGLLAGPRTRSWVGVLVALGSAAAAVGAVTLLGGTRCGPLDAACGARPAHWVAGFIAVETVLALHAASSWSALQLRRAWVTRRSMEATPAP